MKVRQRRPRDAGSVVTRKRADGSDAFMLKWKGYTRTVAVTSKAEAMKLLPAFVAEAQSGAIERERASAAARNAQPTLDQWSETFLAQHVSQSPDRLSTRLTYQKAFRFWILPALGSHRLHEITAPMVRDALQAQFHAGRSVATLKLVLAILRRALGAAVEDGVIQANPVPTFAKLRLGLEVDTAEVARRSALTQTQVSALLAACSEPSLRLFVAVLASCGLRPGEGVGLRWRDVDTENSVIHVRGSAKRAYPAPGLPLRVWIGATKTKSSVRDVAIGPALSALLDTERERQEAMQRMLRGHDGKVREIVSLLPADACVFPSDVASAEGLTVPVDPYLVARRFGRAAAQAGVKATPHALRHTSISHAIEAGLSLADTAARAGHGSVMTTARTYVHAVNESQRKAALIGDGLLGAAERPRNRKRTKPGHK